MAHLEIRRSALPALVAAASFLLILGQASAASAQDEVEETGSDESDDEDSGGAGDEAAGEAEGEEAEPEIDPEVAMRVEEAKVSPWFPRERKKQTYLEAGVRYRTVFIPKFLINAFPVKGGETIVAHTPGFEFVVRENSFQYALFAQLGFYGMNNVPFKGDDDWEMINADLGIYYLGADFMWGTDEITKGLSFLYGAGFGLGIVTGGIKRTEAEPVNGPPDQEDSYQACQGPTGGVCEPQTIIGPDGVARNNPDAHYNYEEPSWFDGGGSPVIFPWIALQGAVRYKFHKNIITRFDFGLMPTGGFVGVAAGYGF